MHPLQHPVPPHAHGVDGASTSTCDATAAALAPSAPLPRQTRRRALLLWAGAAASVGASPIWAASAPARAPQLAGRSESALSQELRAKGYRSDGLELEFPELADSAHSVDFAVQVTAPPGLRLKELEVILPENPFPSAVKLRLPQPQERYRLATRLRLAASQAVWAIATFDDGSVRAANAATLVTSSACLDES